MAYLIIAIIGAALAVIQSGYSGLVTKNQSEASRIGNKLIADVAKKLSSNNALLTQAYQAWTNKSSKLANSIFQGMGFGSRANALIKAIDQNDSWYKQLLSETNQANINLEQISNAASTAVNSAIGLRGSKKSKEALVKAEAKMRGYDQEDLYDENGRSKATGKTYDEEIEELRNPKSKLNSIQQNIDGGVVNS